MDNMIRQLYEGLKNKDAAAIAGCYHPDAEFSDPVFDLRGRGIVAMWHMLCEAGKDMVVSYRDIRSQGTDGSGSGSGHWEAVYTFSLTGRKVHNKMDSTFRFKDGKIIGHIDRFGFWRWSRLALGLPGLLLGWTPILRGKIRARARGNLDRFLASHPEYR